MENVVYTRNTVADICNVGADMVMTAADVMEEFQHALDRHGELMGIGFAKMRTEYDAKWVITKIRFEIDALPRSGQNIETKTWALKPGAIRCSRAFSMTADGAPAVRALSDWCIMSRSDDRLLKVSDTGLVISQFQNDRAIKTPFANPSYEPSADELVYSRKMLASDLDFNSHVNNVSYVRMAVDCFTSHELHSINMRSFELHYARQCYEGETVSFYRRAESDGFLICAECGGMRVFTAAVNK